MSVKILVGDCREMLKTLPDESVHCCVTSPPYFGLRDYGVAGQMGLEESPDAFIAGMVEVFREVRRVLRDDGTLWLNIGDSYCSTDKWGGGKNGNTGKQTVSDNGDVPSWAIRQKRTHVEGVKPKDLWGIPWMLAFALRADGWYLRQDIIWSKPNPMPESVRDRCTKSHEYLFLLTKSPRYYYDADAIAEDMAPSSVTRLSQDIDAQAGSDRVPGKTNGKMKAVARTDKQRGHARRHAGFNERWDAMSKEEQCSGSRNKRDVWTIATQPFSEAHFATFPPALVEPCVIAGCPQDGTVLDPFFGAGTTGLVADRMQRNCIGIELNPTYAEIARKRISGDSPLFAEVA